MSAALDDFNAYIAARKAQVTDYNTARKAAVTGSTLSNGEKNQIRALLDAYTADVQAMLDTFIAKGENYYVRVCKEEASHIRRHISAARNATNTAQADFFEAVVDSLTAEGDALTLAAAKALEG